MRIGETAVDVVKMEDGAWVGEKYGTPIPEMGNLCLKVRGSNNKAWRKLAGRLVDGVPRSKRVAGRIAPDEMDRISAICLRDAGLLDWEFMEGDDDKPLAYSKEQAGAFLTDPQYVKFRDAVQWACNIVAEKDQAETDDDAKNSPTPSAGS